MYILRIYMTCWASINLNIRLLKLSQFVPCTFLVFIAVGIMYQMGFIVVNKYIFNFVAVNILLTI